MIDLINCCIQFFIPTCCILCQKSQAETICANCLQELSFFKTPRCTICATPSHQWVCQSCYRQRPAFDASYCVSDTQSRLQIPLRNLLTHSSLHMTAGILKAWEKLSAHNYAPVDLLIPTPLSPESLAKRGFNQAWELSKQMSAIKKIPTTPFLLRKHHCKIDVQQTKTLRTQFLKRSFYLDKNELIKINGLRGKRIGVVDDFMNSGATLNAIAELLKENGATWVSNWVILRTPSPELY